MLAAIEESLVFKGFAAISEADLRNRRVTSVWRLGDVAVAAFGKDLSETQDCWTLDSCWLSCVVSSVKAQQKGCKEPNPVIGS